MPPQPRYPNGFAGCGPGKPYRDVGGGVVECDGDMTYWWQMPGYDVVPKCKTCAIDDPWMPCGGAPSCDDDHMACKRVEVGCGGRNWDNREGPDLAVTGTGLVSLDRWHPFLFTMRVKKGSLLTLTACFPKDFKTKDGLRVPIPGNYCMTKQVQY
jgi:hypothetical protein